MTSQRRREPAALRRRLRVQFRGIRNAGVPAPERAALIGRRRRRHNVPGQRQDLERDRRRCGRQRQHHRGRLLLFLENM